MSATAPATVPATPSAAAPTASAGPFAFSMAPPAALCSFSAGPPFELALELRLRAAALPLDRDPVAGRRERDDALGVVRVAAFARGRDPPLFDALLALFVLAPLRALLPELPRDFALLLPELARDFALLLPELARDFALVLRVPPDDFAVVAIDLTSLPYYVRARTRLPKRSAP